MSLDIAFVHQGDNVTRAHGQVSEVIDMSSKLPANMPRLSNPRSAEATFSSAPGTA